MTTQDPKRASGPRESSNDNAPTKGTNEPWKRPGQLSQNPSEPEPQKPDLENGMRRKRIREDGDA